MNIVAIFFEFILYDTNKLYRNGLEFQIIEQ